MTAKRLVFTRPEDGGVTIVHIANSTRMLLPRKGFPPLLEPEAYWLQRMAAHVLPANAQDAHVVNVQDIPTDHTFRDAWSHEAGVISVRMDKAKEIHRDKLRAARKPMLEQLDIEYQRAHEQDDKEKLQTVAAAKQLLRDITAHPDIDAAQTPEELKAVWPFGESNSPVPITQKSRSIDADVLPLAPTADGGHSTGWVGKLVGRIDAADVELGEAPMPIVPEQPEPEAPYHLPPQAPPPAPLDDAARRRAAKAHIRSVAAGFAWELEAERLRYERALLAHNGSVEAIADMSEEARAAGVSVRDLAERIVNAHTVHARKMIRVKSIQDQALADLDNAAGDDIVTIEQKAVAEMTGDTYATVDG